jgi:hypothetical protein
MSLKLKIKKILTPFFITLSNQLRLPEHERILNHIAHQVKVLDEKQQKLDEHIKAVNAVVTGLYSKSDSLYDEFNLAPYEVLELSKILNSSDKNDITTFNTFSFLKNIDFKNQSVVVLGDNTNVIKEKLNKLGVKKTIQIKFSQKTNKNNSKNEFFIYPMDLNKITIDSFDILLCLDHNISSILIKNRLFGLGIKVKKIVILKARVLSNTVFKESIDPKIILNENNRKITFNDNFLRYKLHYSGFNEVACLYTYETNIDNYFDKKITSFRYKNGFYIKQSNNKSKKNKKYNNSNSVYKIYIGSKLPSVKNINRS